VEYVAVRPSVLAQAGGLEGWSRRLGGQVLAHDLVDRVLAAGHHVAHQDVPLAPAGRRGKRAAWRVERAAGAQAMRRLVDEGGLPGGWRFLRATPFSRRPQRLVFRGTAFASGAAAALRDARAPGRAGPGPPR
jgi:hypothetical protein